jgi:hypothetical protein
MPLAELNLFGCVQVRDLEPLKGMLLTRLNLYSCAVKDLAPLKGMPLTALFLAACGQVNDVSSLTGMPLKDLNIDNTQVPDLNSLQGMSLTSLSMWGCVRVQDLEPLRDMPLTLLALPQCPKVKDLGPVARMRLKRLEIVDTGVTDLTPLRGTSLESITLTPKNINQGVEILRRMKSLKTIRTERLGEDIPAAEFWTRYDKGEFK